MIETDCSILSNPLGSIYDRDPNLWCASPSTPPGRVRSFLKYPSHNSPYSCALYVYRMDLADCLFFSAVSLKFGSGVKIHFPEETVVSKIWERPVWGVTATEGSQAYPDVISDFNYVSYEEIDPETIVKVEDSMLGENGIINSWCKAVNRAGLPTFFDLSSLRAKGTENERGLVASGPISFIKIYESLYAHFEQGTIFSLLCLLGQVNACIRQGGYKRGIITSAMNYRCPLIFDYLQKAPLAEIPGAHKKGIEFNDGIYDLYDPDSGIPLSKIIVEKRNSESLFYEKVNEVNPELHANVCEGIYIADRASCLIWRYNLGLLEKPDQIPELMRQATLDACELHVTWREMVSPDSRSLCAPLEEDRQIGLDVFGFNNFISRLGVSYKEFNDALEERLFPSLNSVTELSSIAVEIVDYLIQGFKLSTFVADLFMDERNLPRLDAIHTVEPAQSHAFECKDILGNTICRGIFAPAMRRENRNSDSMVNRVYYYGKVQTAAEIGVQEMKRNCQLWQSLMNLYGRPHSISQNTYTPMDESGLKEFLHSSTRTLYYYEPNTLDQGEFLAKRAGIAVGSCGLEKQHCVCDD